MTGGEKRVSERLEQKLGACGAQVRRLKSSDPVLEEEYA